MYRLSALSRAAKPLSRSALSQVTARVPVASKRAPATLVSSFHTNQSRFAKAAAPETNDAFLQGNAANYVEEMYEAWLRDPSSVHLSWQVYFKNMANGVAPGQAYTPPPTLVPSASARLPSLPDAVIPGATSSSEIIDHMKIQLLVRAYQVRGHHLANLDPLGIQHADIQHSIPPELSHTYYGFTEKDLDRSFSLGPGILPAFMNNGKSLTLREIIDALKKTYCKYNIHMRHFGRFRSCISHSRRNDIYQVVPSVSSTSISLTVLSAIGSVNASRTLSLTSTASKRSVSFLTV